MGTCIRIFILFYLLLNPHYAFAFDHVTIVNEDTIDKELNDTVYQKNLFQLTSYLNAGYDYLYKHTGTIYQSVHTHYLIVGMKIPMYRDIPEPSQNSTRIFSMARNFKLTTWRSNVHRQCCFFNGLFNLIQKEGSHLYTKVFQDLHSDIPALLPNQEIKFLSRTENPLQQAEENEVTNTTCLKRSTDEFPTMAEKHRLESYWTKYDEQFPSDFDTLYTNEKCNTCDQRHREKRFKSALIKGLSMVMRGASVFG